MRRVGRRAVLGALGAGLAAGATPRGLRADPPAPPPKRLVIVMQNNGTQQANFWPREGFAASPILAPLLDRPALARRTAVVKGLAFPLDNGGTDGNEHDVGFARLFTGHPLLSVGGHPWGGGPSVDQLVARAWGVPPLTLAVLASAVEPFPKPGFQHRRSLSYVAPGVHALPTVDPRAAYERLFALADTSTEAARRELALRRSALDAVAEDVRELSGRLGRVERDKLELHLASVRRLELDMARTLTAQRCVTTPAAPTGYAARPELLVNDEAAIPELVDQMSQLIAAAIGCGVTRVATLQLGYAGGKWRFDWEGVGVDLHGEVAHRDTSDEGTSEENTARLVRANRYYAGVVARLAERLDAIPEADGTTALDHTLIVWGNELGRGDHSLENVPLVLVGGVGAGVRTGGRLIDRGRQPFQRVGCTILRAMGVEARGFGDAPECGPIDGL